MQRKRVAVSRSPPSLALDSSHYSRHESQGGSARNNRRVYDPSFLISLLVRRRDAFRELGLAPLCMPLLGIADAALMLLLLLVAAPSPWPSILLAPLLVHGDVVAGRHQGRVCIPSRLQHPKVVTRTPPRVYRVSENTKKRKLRRDRKRDTSPQTQINKNNQSFFFPLFSPARRPFMFALLPRSRTNERTNSRCTRFLGWVY